ncbi:hypothetical protein [Sandaracinus amylolyticus]|uniref:hypothetical protein n=1 Tax=Sandaracinus amylolyticus TaxID=927083 RepID=UPI001F48F16C|nr:hypothetical protein [Sandaracinus amylolyticus]UJR84082.1 Hypothetical protein I5071_61530 [Sandaracinus amylolyticus]
MKRIAIAVALGVVLGWARADAQGGGEQTVLGPGLYVFQTRTRAATCGDDERTGYVTSFVAPIDGVPGSRTMRMRTPDSQYWSSWTITIGGDDAISGEAFLTGSSGPNRPVSRFTVRRDRDRFTGQGVRSYDATVGGATRRCEVTYDALLRRIDA